MFWTLIIFIITISILVVVHEFGHFIIAKICGVYVERFSVGFGKVIWSRLSKNGTEFVISTIPLGGYVKMRDSRNEVLSEEDKQSAYDIQPIWKRACIVSAGPIANFILALLIYWIVFQIGVLTYPVKVSQTLPNTPISTINIPQNAELKSISGIKVEGWGDVNSALISQLGNDSVEMTYALPNDSIQYHKKVDIRDWSFDLEKESPISAFGFVPAKPELLPIVSRVVSDSAADKAGVKVGDKIIGYNTTSYDSWDKFVAAVKEGKPLALKIKRDQQTVVLNITPIIELNQDGEKVGLIGIYPTSNTIVKQYDIVSAFTKSIERTQLTLSQVVKSFYQLLTGVISVKNLSGPITIAKGAELTASYGISSYLMFLAFISVSLGVVNLVPLPMLDGGHLLFLLIEKIKGSPLSEAKLAMCYRLGNLLLVVIMAIALFNDFARL